MTPASDYRLAPPVFPLRSLRPLRLIFTLLLLSSVASADDWSQFRGPAALSVADRVELPTEWSAETGKNIAWTAELPGKGVSSPIVVEGRVIVTADTGADNQRLHVLAFNSATGEKLWQRNFWAVGRTLVHATSAVAAPTPCSDGEHLYAFYSSNDLICLSLDGDLKWIRNLTEDHPGLGNDIGMSSSPVVAEDVVVVQCESKPSSFVAGFDATTGEKVWEIARAKESNWTSPVIVRYENGSASQTGVLLQNRNSLSLHDVQSGEELWTEIFDGASIASPAGSSEIFAAADGLTYLRRSPEGMEVVWRASSVRPGTPSPVYYPEGSRVFTFARGGILNATNTEDGERVFKKRLGGTFWSTPVLVGGKLYCVNDEGESFVVDAGSEKGDVIAGNNFGEPILGSPAIADGGMFVRSHGRLWKIAVTDEPQ